MLYGTKCWVVRKQHIYKMCVTEMKMLRWISRTTRKDKIQNKEISLKDRGGHYWWKDEEKSLEMVWSCSKENN